MIEVNKFDAIQIGIASPEKIRSWSHGEVKKPETINYRTLKPEKDGLFCARIFGPTKDWECLCGKYKRIRYEGIICDRCGVEVTRKAVRRERMGHIELAAPVTHLWYFKGTSSRIGLILDMKAKQLEEVIYFVSHVVLEPGDTGLEKKQVLSEREYRAYYEKYGKTFKVGIGAEAIRDLLKAVDLKKEKKTIVNDLVKATGQKRAKLLKRLNIVTALIKSGNKPEWMVFEVLPVIPPEIRPMIQLDGGRFATSDLNDLYRRVINRNNRLKRLLDLGAPGIIVQNEKRMLQEAVDALIDNGRRGRPVTGAGNRPLRSLAHMLKGKQGRFRQNLLGKRVDYSGRSVIVVGPKLKMYQCGIPKEMAVELFKPHVIRELVEREIAHNIKSAKKLIDNFDERIWDVVEDVIKEKTVLLNRAPTLHRLGIQAFEPKLIDGRAIRLHPLVTTAFNADFDGDQMAVHVPLSEKAQAEANILMLASNNILNPKDGKPIVTPSQDMVLGNYYLTKEYAGGVGEGRIFKNANEVIMNYENELVELHTRIAVPARAMNNPYFTEEQNNSYLITTPGKIIFNNILPEDFIYINEPTESNIQGVIDNKFFVKPGVHIKKYIKAQDVVAPFKKGTLGAIIAEIFKKYETHATSAMLDELKDLGFKYSTLAGISIAASDVQVSPSKHKIISDSDKQVEAITTQYQRGLITDKERYRKVVDVWSKAKKEIQNDLEKNMDSENSIFMMSDSGARGNLSNFTQLAGMRGLMAKPTGEEIEIPVKASFREGLTVSEFFISTHGARKGGADKALRTADSGYLTRRLVDVALEVIVREADCGTETGLVVRDFTNEKDGTIIEDIYKRILGRYSNRTVTHPKTKEIIVNKNELINEDIADQIIEAGFEEIEIRSVLTCKAKYGVCEKCYGRNLATGKGVEVGEAVGVVAAQSIGEPGTQLTMRTFHTGGVAGVDITQGLPRVQELFEAREPKLASLISEINGTIDSIAEEKGRYTIVITNELETREYITIFDAVLLVKKGDQVKCGQKLTDGSIDPKELLRVSDTRTVQEYILKEIQKVYRLQGIDIGDKHIEIITRQMMSKVIVIDAGDTKQIPGSKVDINKFTEMNKKVITKGGQPAIGRPIILGITKASLETESFLSAASFQETTRILTDAAIAGKVDHLVGLKENVIIGKLIPAGTGIKVHSDVDYDLEVEKPTEVDKTTEEIII